MDSDFKKRQVSVEQMNALLNFLKDHSDLAKGLNRGRRGKLHNVKIWSLCAKQLNIIKDGTIKDGKGWAKYWSDWKYRVRRHALELRAAKDSNRPLPDDVTPLTAMEETILSIIGNGAVDGIVIKQDPLVDGALEDELDSFNNDEVPIEYSGTRAKTRRGRKRRHSSQDSSDMDQRSELTSPVDRKPRVKRNGRVEDMETDAEAMEFLRLEKEKLEDSKRLTDSVQRIATEITRLADVMSHIRDVLINNRLNI